MYRSINNNKLFYLMENCQINLEDSNDSIIESQLSTSSNESSFLGPFNKWYLRSNFEVKTSNALSKTFSVKCLLCAPKTKILQESTSSTPNLHCHIKSQHAEVLEKAVKRKASKDSLSVSSSASCTSSPSRSKIQTKLHEFSGQNAV